MQDQLALEFEMDDGRAGFRLHRLEVLNWGTFHRKVWVIEPAGCTSLLTGSNGSGKSTLVDALLTLLVPNVKRSYNQASGADRRRERDERTYVLGAYGRVRGEESHTYRTQYLRTKDDYSVLLAQFHNEGFRSRITLAQVFWIQDGAIRKFNVVASSDLHIDQHFSHFSEISELKKRLRATPGVELFEQFSDYGRRFRKIFGLRTEKALDLFNQTVTIKEIGDLNGFVRNHMLDRTDVQDRINQLRLNYENLTRSHDAILKARQQLELLRPLMDEAASYMKQADRVTELASSADAIPACFARKRTGLLDEAAAEAERRLVQVRRRAEEIGRDIETLRHQQRDIEIAISGDAAGQRVRDIDAEVRRIEGRMAARRQQAEKHAELATKLNFPSCADEKAFLDIRRRCLEMKQRIDVRLLELNRSHVELQIQLRGIKDGGAEIVDELESLRQRKSQIPEQNLRIRQRILEAFEISETEIPFIGELLKVKDEEREWEGAIERVLHNLALRMLVPERHYRDVNYFVNHTNLRGRIVYHRVGERRLYAVRHAPEPEALIHKLRIMPGTEFHDWIKNELLERFNYICCDNLDMFQREPYAITKQGLVKSGNSMHVKDDRFSIDDRRQYVLGWNNLDKVAAIEASLAEQMRKLREVEASINAADTERKRLYVEKEWVRDLLQFDAFSSIDWRTDQAEIDKLHIQRRDLERGSDQLHLLHGQLTEVSMRIKDREVEKSATEREANYLDKDILDYRKKKTECEAVLSFYPCAVVDEYAGRLEERLKGETLTLANIETLQRREQESLRRATDDEKSALNRIQNQLEKSMLHYKHLFPTETADADASIASLGEFERMLRRIEWEDLPRYEKRFKELLDEKVISEIAFFKSALERQVDEIELSIANLNESLRMIDYTPSTFIQLACETNRDPEILEFRVSLGDCLPDPGQPATSEANEESFRRIKDLIDRFNADDRWTAKVTDVRNWLNFSASERYKEDNTEKHFYSDSAGKSGGQKAKLAYTILASAIAFQFGLDHGAARSRSFRFVVVDEAFSKSDEANARYAMELFRKLNLQLLVVTPPKSNDIHIVEPYISACHYVTNTLEENDSRVYNLSMEQYQEKKKSFIQSAVHDDWD